MKILDLSKGLSHKFTPSLVFLRTVVDRANAMTGLSPSTGSMAVAEDVTTLKYAKNLSSASLQI